MHDKRDSIKDVCWASSRGAVRNGNVSQNDTTGIHYILKNILDQSKLFQDVAAKTKKGNTLFTVDGVKFIACTNKIDSIIWNLNNWNGT